MAILVSFILHFPIVIYNTSKIGEYDISKLVLFVWGFLGYNIGLIMFLILFYIVTLVISKTKKDYTPNLHVYLYMVVLFSNISRYLIVFYVVYLSAVLLYSVSHFYINNHLDYKILYDTLTILLWIAISIGLTQK